MTTPISEDPRFDDLVDHSARVEHLGGDCIWAEGPTWLPERQALVWSEATIDFLARGGDGYNFGGLPFTTLGVTYEQAMLNYLAGPLNETITQAQYPNQVGTRVIQVG
jgi:hypothetical protein